MLSPMRARLLVLALLASGCTTVGAGMPEVRESMDFGPRAELRVCLFVDPAVGDARARELVAGVDREFDLYGIDVTVVRSQPWQRPSFTTSAMLAKLRKRPLAPPCDRLVAFVGRNLGDALWGLLMPEVLGAVDGETGTHGVIAGRMATPNQLISPPGRATIHEFYHLVGCPHAFTKRTCYSRIQALKRARQPGADFFPAATFDGKPLPTRAAVERERQRVREAQ